MTNKVLSKELIGKNVVTQGGFPVGQIDDIVIDTDTGEFVYLLVNTSQSAKQGTRIDEKGRSILTFSSMKVTENNVIIP